MKNRLVQGIICMLAFDRVVRDCERGKFLVICGAIEQTVKASIKYGQYRDLNIMEKGK